MSLVSKALRCAGALAAIGALVGQSACAELHPIGDGVCGNVVIDVNEDCDRFAPGGGTACAAPGTAHECRFVCEGGASCPAGYGCGGDGVCRRGTGQLVMLGDAVLLPSVQELVAGDFNGDGTDDVLTLADKDILGRRAARVLYAPAADGSGSAQVSLPVLIGAVVAGDFNGDPATEIGFADVNGVGLLGVRADQRLEFAAFPALLPDGDTHLRALLLDVLPGEAGDELVTFVSHAPGKVDIERPAGVLPSLKIASVSGDADQVSVAAGRFGHGPLCDTIVFSFPGAAEAYVVSPCRSGMSGVEWSPDSVVTSIALPAGVKVTGGVQVADMDLDGYPDVLILTGSGLHVAWGAMDGSLTSEPGGKGTKDLAGAYALPKAAGGADVLPLVAADLDGDYIVDFVVPRGVVVSGGGRYTLAYETLGVPWATAIVADLNANGLPDVVAAPEDSLDLDFLNNAGLGVFNPSLLVTDGPVIHLAAGDFDGDLIKDLAYIEAREEGGEGTNEVELFFGNPNGPPSDQVLLTLLPGVSTTLAGHLAAQGGPGGQSVADGIADLVVVSEGPAGDSDRLFAFRGNGARFMTAVLPLRTAENAARPIAFTHGSFGDPTDDLAALGVDLKTGDLHLWRVEAAEDLTLSELVPSAAFDEGFRIEQKGPALLPFGAAMAAGDLDKEGNDDLVVVASYGPDKSGAALVFADYLAGAHRFELESIQPLDLRIRAGSSLSLRDVDGDGELDAILYTGGGVKDGRAVVLWSDGQGGIDVSSLTMLDPGAGVTGLSCMPSASGPGCELLVLTSEGAYRGALGGGRAITLERVADLPGGSALSLGDFDHDGVVDVAVGGELGVQLFRSLPEHP